MAGKNFNSLINALGGLTGLPVPVASSDAVTKSYVDTAAARATVQTANYTAVLGDAGTVVEMNVATANTFTIPPNSSVAFPVGTVITVFQFGAGQTTLTAGAGVTILSDGAKVRTAAQYATVGLRKRATDSWVATGDLV